MKSNSFGLKEVADVYFININDVLVDGKIPAITASGSGDTLEIKVGSKKVLTDGSDVSSASTEVKPRYIFDSLKVSNVEVSSEETSARGGKGNPELISWSYGKEATLTIEDALMSLETFHLQFGSIEGENAGNVVTIDANSFPGSYLVIGSTVIRSFRTGDDEAFIFVAPKAKVNVEGTLTMEADGDPTTFEMSLKALAAEVGSDKDVLLKFIKPTATKTYYATIAHDATSAVTIEAEGIAASDTGDGSDDLTIACTADTITITKADDIYAGSTYKFTIKDNASATKAYLIVTVA